MSLALVAPGRAAMSLALVAPGRAAMSLACAPLRLGELRSPLLSRWRKSLRPNDIAPRPGGSVVPCQRANRTVRRAALASAHLGPFSCRAGVGCGGLVGDRIMAMFIRVDVDQAVVRKTPGLAKKLVEVCPVNIFTPAGDGVAVVDDNVDECTLCDLCTQASPDGVRIVKLYEA
jgi:NAD-dependent dihydropyrimidine dehydrogenase PreA subunit